MAPAQHAGTMCTAPHATRPNDHRSVSKRRPSITDYCRRIDYASSARNRQHQTARLPSFRDNSEQSDALSRGGIHPDDEPFVKDDRHGDSLFAAPYRRYRRMHAGRKIAQSARIAL
jgi:hypothetical protein